MQMSEAQRAQLRAIRAAMDESVTLATAQGAAKLNAVAVLVREWTPGIYKAGDVRAESGVPYKCVQPHDSTQNADWRPSAVPALWMQYHGTSRETARPYVAPTGAQDIYKAGEWMIWTNGRAAKALVDTSYGPDALPNAWLFSA